MRTQSRIKAAAEAAMLQLKSECAFCHMASAKKDDAWSQFYPLLDTEVVDDGYPWPLATCPGGFPSMCLSTRETND